MNTMKTKVFIFTLFLGLAFYACDDDISLPSPDTDSKKNVSIKLQNLPDEVKDKSGVIFVYKGEELYSNTSFKAKDESTVRIHMPQNQKCNIAAFIIQNGETWNPNKWRPDQWSQWTPPEEYGTIWFAISNDLPMINSQQKQLDLMSKEWTVLNNGGTGQLRQIINCNISAPADNSTFTINDIISVTVEAEDNSYSQIANVIIYLDGNEIANMENSTYYYHDINTTDLEKGKHTLLAEAENENSKIATDDITFYIESDDVGDPPHITINNISNQIVQGDSVLIEADINDPDGQITNATLLIDDNEFEFTDTVGTLYQYNWKTESYGLGMHEIKVTAKDNDDNQRMRRENVEVIDQ